jgi:hypothetical protein
MKKRAGLIAKRGFDQRTPLDLDKIDSILATLGVKSYRALRRDRREQLALLRQPDGDPVKFGSNVSSIDSN